jgi:signal-transduction protein with cAMP-binding, CBS, and nucleotidyltransferase domain
MVHQSGQRRRGEKLDKLIDPRDLSAYQVDVLKDSMRAVKRLQDLLQGRHGLVNF